MGEGKKIEKIVEDIAGITVLELSELKKALKDKLGVTPMSMAAPAAAAGAAAEAAPAAGGTQTVVITNAGANKIAVIKALREINQNLGLQEAKAMTETLPAEVLKDAKAEDVKSASEKLKAAVATVELK